MLDMMQAIIEQMQAIIERTEAQRAALVSLIDERECAIGEVRGLLFKAEALGALPSWMIEHGKRATGADK